MGELKGSKRSFDTTFHWSSTESEKPLRLRIFAGPNGSGKSTVIHSLHHIQEQGHLLDFGIYVNADDIAKQLRTDRLNLDEYQIGQFSLDHFLKLASKTGILSERVTIETLKSDLRFESNQIFLTREQFAEEAAMILAACIREELLARMKRFSFETVFSHPSKISIIKRASDAGFKVYLYFVGTSSPGINTFRVQSRVLKGGHNVEQQKIIDRYYRSMNLLWEAAQYCYRVYFFDNSSEGEESTLFAHFKVIHGKKVWTIPDARQVPEWFLKYYVERSKSSDSNPV